MRRKIEVFTGKGMTSFIFLDSFFSSLPLLTGIVPLAFKLQYVSFNRMKEKEDRKCFQGKRNNY